VVFAEVSVNGSAYLFLSPQFESIKRWIYKFKKQNNQILHKWNDSLRLMC